MSSKTFEEQTSEQYAALGRFVVAFERTVDAVRSAAMQRLVAGNSVLHQRLVNTVLHHSAFTAGPLLDVLRGLCAEILKEPAYKWSDADATVLRAVLDQVAVDYGDLLKQRNIIVHGTWYVGYGPQGATEFPDMGLSKWKITKDGFASAGGPRTAADLLDLCRRCDEVTKLVRTLNSMMIFRGNVQKNLVKQGGRWVAPGAADPS